MNCGRVLNKKQIKNKAGKMQHLKKLKKLQKMIIKQLALKCKVKLRTLIQTKQKTKTNTLKTKTWIQRKVGANQKTLK